MPDDIASQGAGDPVDDHRFDWELCCENVKPRKHGRKVESVNQALSHVPSAGSRVEVLTNEKFEQLMLEAESAEDPLAKCIEFCNWFEDTYPIGRQRIYYQFLWKIVNHYGKEARYLEDDRMLRIWESMADNSMGHGWEVYQHANSIGSLIRHAAFYVRWANELERRGNIGEARSILRRAKANGATPIEIVNSEEDELEMRALRRETERTNADDSWNDEEDPETRIALSRIASIGETPVAPVMRLPSIVGESGSRKLHRGGSTAKKQKPLPPSNNGVGFEVFIEDDETERCYLEGVYEMDNHIERLTISEECKEQFKANKVALKKVHPPSNHGFTVWEDDDNKENVEPNAAKAKKPVLHLKKQCIRDISIEEYMASIYEESESYANRRHVVARKIDFDDDDDE